MQFGDQILNCRHVERACRDKQDEIRLNRTVFRYHGRTFYDGQNITLYPFTGNVRAVSVALACDFVNFVDEYDTIVFRAVKRFRLDGILVHEFVRFFHQRNLERLFHGQTAFFLLLREHIPEDTADRNRRCAGHQFHGLLRGIHHFHFHHEIIVPTIAQAVQKLCFPHLFRGVALFVLLRFNKDTQKTFFRRRSCASLYFFFLFRFYKTVSAFRQITDHALNVLTHVTYLGVFRCLHLHEGGFDKLRKTAGNFRFTNTRRTFHDDVFRGNFLADFLGQLRPSITVTKRDGNRLFRIVLTDDISV